jgi:hypothetical protein
MASWHGFSRKHTAKVIPFPPMWLGMGIMLELKDVCHFMGNRAGQEFVHVPFSKSEIESHLVTSTESLSSGSTLERVINHTFGEFVTLDSGNFREVLDCLVDSLFGIGHGRSIG